MEEGVKEKLRQQIRSYLLRLASQSDAEHPAWNQELIRKGSGNRWNYIDGCMISGMLRFSELIREEGLFDFSERFVSHFISEGGEIPSYRREEYRLDDLNPGRNLFLLFERTGKEKYRKALQLLRGQLETQPRTEEGSFWHKKIYQEQVWLDGIYMALPFYLEYELRFHPGDLSGLYDIVSQLRIVKKRMREEESGLYVHGYDASRKAFWADPESGRSPNVWLRAIGWFSLALSDLLGLMKGFSDFQAEKEELSGMLRELIESLMPWQDPWSGCFYQLPKLPELKGNYIESSGSALISAAVLKAVRLSFLPEKYRSFGESIFSGIYDNFFSCDEGGELQLKNICLVAGLGGKERRDGSVRYYLSEAVVENDAKGIGPFLLAGSELLS